MKKDFKAALAPPPVPSRGRRTSCRAPGRPTPAGRRAAARAARPRAPGAAALPGRRHVVPDRHRPHLHGGRGARGRRPQGRRHDRRSRPRARPAPSRSRPRIAAAGAVIFAHDLGVRDPGRFAGKPVVDVGRQEGPNRRRPDALIAEALRSPATRTRSGSRPSRGRRCGRRGGAEHESGAAAPVAADDRCVVHDPVRRGRRHPDRPLLHARRRRGRRRRARSRSTNLYNLDTERLHHTHTRCSARAS